MATKCCEALRFITLDSKSSQNDSFFTLVETSENDIKNDQTRKITVEFVFWPGCNTHIWQWHKASQ